MNISDETQFITAPQYNTVDMLLNQVLEGALSPSILASESGFSKADMIIKAADKLSQMLYGEVV